MKLRGRGGERRSMREGREGVRNGWKRERAREGEEEREGERERGRESEAIGVERGKQRSM